MNLALDSRARFEACARELPNHTPNYHKRFPKEAGAAGGKYFDPVTELAWEAWQAAIASLAAPGPMFWVRLRSDGFYDGPIHNDCIEHVRKQSGAWTPLYPLPAPPTPKDPPIAALAAKETRNAASYP